MKLKETYHLETRADAARLLLDMVRPLKPFYTPGKAWLKVGDTAGHYGEKSARMEGFARVLWGLAPLWAQDNQDLPKDLRAEAEEWCNLYQEGMIHGTDPEHPEYWGEVPDFDQKMVEIASIVTALCLVPDKLWDPLTEKQKDNLYQWINQINSHKVHPNNWRFFRILTNMTFRKLGLPWSEECFEDDWKIIEGCYDGDGWYYDGNPHQMDYYIPFAMHFYGLIYSQVAQWDQEKGNVLRQRAQQFAQDFVYWFAGNGAEVPYGRSLTYRFAHSAAFSAMAFAGVEGPGYGVLKNLVLGNLEQWSKRPIFDAAGVLSVGYGYPNLIMCERYNSPGSPYWAFKTFLMLALPADHPFWAAERTAYPYEPQKTLEKPHMIVSHNDADHVLMYPVGQYIKRGPGCGPEKYEKFVYSNEFGFSVSRSCRLAEGAFDNTFAVSLAGEEHYRIRNVQEAYHVTETETWSRYQLMPGVRVETTIIPKGPWHIRKHVIETEYEIDALDGGFAIKSEPCFDTVSGVSLGKYRPEQVLEGEDFVATDFDWGFSGIKSACGGRPELVRPFPNTNLFYNVTVIPTIHYHLQPGRHELTCFVFGDISSKAKEMWDQGIVEE